jgi:hypothetical protein
MGCPYCARKQRLAATFAPPPAPVVLGEEGMTKVRYLGDGKGRVAGAVTDYWYQLTPESPLAWVDARDVDGLLTLSYNDSPLFEVV